MDLVPLASDSVTIGAGAGVPGEAGDENIQIEVEKLDCASVSKTGLSWLKPEIQSDLIILK